MCYNWHVLLIYKYLTPPPPWASPEQMTPRNRSLPPFRTATAISPGQDHRRSLPYQAAWLLNQRPIHPVHLVIETACVAEVMPGAVSSPQRRGNRAAIHALAALREVLRLDVVHCVSFTMAFSENWHRIARENICTHTHTRIRFLITRGTERSSQNHLRKKLNRKIIVRFNRCRQQSEDVWCIVYVDYVGGTVLLAPTGRR